MADSDDASSSLPLRDFGTDRHLSRRAAAKAAPIPQSTSCSTALQFDNKVDAVACAG
jgi:hypothetical protein